MRHILVVDDSATMRRMVMASLRGLPALRFSEAGNGLEAIERMALDPLDLMVLDLNMPDMHGLEVIRFVRAHAAYAALPILVLTTRGDGDSRSAVEQAGGSAYLTKPFEPATLVQQVQRLLAAG
jgi:two-component system chemotaxis response regulator CheY